MTVMKGKRERERERKRIEIKEYKLNKVIKV